MKVVLLAWALAALSGCSTVQLAGARGLTQYAYVFVQQEAEELEERNLAESRRLEERARHLYRRARDYGLSGLGLRKADLVVEPQRILSESRVSSAPLLYWTAVSWGALIALSKDSPELIAELSAVQALIERALVVDEAFDHGAIHTFLIALDPERGREHFRRSVELSEGKAAAPLVALAESVSLPRQQRAEFEQLLNEALRIEPKSPHHLENLVAQRRARWLLSRTGRLFID
jgi:predicted anti-sigma-YlaC factor YlaD